MNTKYLHTRTHQYTHTRVLNHNWRNRERHTYHNIFISIYTLHIQMTCNLHRRHINVRTQVNMNTHVRLGIRLVGKCGREPPVRPFSWLYHTEMGFNRTSLWETRGGFVCVYVCMWKTVSSCLTIRRPLLNVPNVKPTTFLHLIKVPFRLGKLI